MAPISNFQPRALHSNINQRKFIQAPAFRFVFLLLFQMGANHSREDLGLSDSDSDSDSDSESEECHQEEEDTFEDAQTPSFFNTVSPKTPLSLEEVEAKFKYQKSIPVPTNAVKLYHYAGGNTANSKWVVSEKLATYSFAKTHLNADVSDDEADEEDEKNSLWVLKIGSIIRVKIDENLQLKALKDQKRADFIANGVWAVKFFNEGDYNYFMDKFQDYLFENTYGYEANDENKVKVYGKDFIGWAKPEKADDSMWEDQDSIFKTPESAARSPVRDLNDLREESEKSAAKCGSIQSLALGALDNSFLVSDSGVQVVRNYSHGIQGKGIYVKFNNGIGRSNWRFNGGIGQSAPRKALLMKAETNMLLMSPHTDGKHHTHTRGLHQLDIETGKIVTEWKFEKDGTDITMKDITNDNKSAQMDPICSTFLGLDDNRLCRWDMRDRNGIVQNIVNGSAPVLNWTQGHQFSRGTNFQCFATTGDGSVAVGSLDGKIRLYSSNSMRQAKTAFPGLGSPITHIDVTFDGKWILGTTHSYLVLICTLFMDKDGKSKTGFACRMGNKISAPRLLKLTPLDSRLAGVNNNFRNAQFSWVTENGKQERHLVATVGKFSVIWNFQQVKDGSHECYLNQVGLKSCYCYKIVLKDDSIVDSRFMHEKYAVSDSPEAPLVVATRSKFSSFSISNRKLNM